MKEMCELLGLEHFRTATIHNRIIGVAIVTVPVETGAAAECERVSAAALVASSVV